MTTSSKTSRAPIRRVRARSPSRNPGSGGDAPLERLDNHRRHVVVPPHHDPFRRLQVVERRHEDGVADRLPDPRTGRDRDRQVHPPAGEEAGHPDVARPVVGALELDDNRAAGMRPGQAHAARSTWSPLTRTRTAAGARTPVRAAGAARPTAATDRSRRRSSTPVPAALPPRRPRRDGRGRAAPSPSPSRNRAAGVRSGPTRTGRLTAPGRPRGRAGSRTRRWTLPGRRRGRGSPRRSRARVAASITGAATPSRPRRARACAPSGRRTTSDPASPTRGAGPSWTLPRRATPPPGSSPR